MLDNIDSNLFGMIMECGKCQFLENIELTQTGDYKVQCYLCGEIFISKSERKAHCGNKDIKDMCDNFYFF